MKYVIPVLFFIIATAGSAAKIVCDGVVGNSGEAGKILVKFGITKHRRGKGIGVVYDRQGYLWDRGGAGRLNQYALDGRLIRQLKIPGLERGTEVLTSVGDYLVLLLNKKLYKYDLKNPDKQKLAPVGIKASNISFGSWNNNLACLDEEGQVFLANPITGETTPLFKCDYKPIRDIELDRNGDVYIRIHKVVHKYVNSKEVKNKNWPKIIAGKRDSTPARIQKIGDYWYGHGWHGTIKRFDNNFQADPGVVLGGASGHFIGHLEENSELLHGQGLAKINDDLFAVSGMRGIIHLLEWNPSDKKMTIIRRIGAIDNVSCLGLDSKGNIWTGGGTRKWNDKPASPQRFGVTHQPAGQAVMVDGDVLFAPALRWGKPSIYYGRFDMELSKREFKKMALDKGLQGTVVYYNEPEKKGDFVMLVINSTGKGSLFRIGKDKRSTFRGNLGKVDFKLSQPLRKWTSLALKDQQTLFGAADGYIIEMKRDGQNWRESRRWKRWADNAEGCFGDSIEISIDKNMLWVADTSNHRILLFDVHKTQPIASYATCRQPGQALNRLNSPTRITANNNRAVVFDSGNQRILKLKVAKESR